jgi:nicotinate phosphoribosyltransferase
MSDVAREPESALLTDLYQLTMLQAYVEGGMTATASFEFFVRKLPPQRNFLVAAGLEQVLDYLEGLRFSAAELEWLAGCGRFRDSFIDWLATLRFTGDVEAMEEGTVFFADEPILRVTAPLPQAQFVESRIINLLQFQSMVASKAARCTVAAAGRLLVDFGLRRAHGAEAGLLSARASYLAGFDGTATVLAGMKWGIPVYGTMAHAFIQAHDDESAAFEHFARSQPLANTMLIDTYDTEAAAHKLVALAARLRPDGITINAVRIDSGDLGEHARRVRAILDAGGLQAMRIFVSGNLDEHAVRELVAAGAPIDGFGVGTRMNTSADYPYLDCAYKLQEYDGEPRRKRSEGKATWPGRKQVLRRRDEHGRLVGDLLAATDAVVSGEALLRPVMRAGRRLAPSPALAELREHARGELAALPDAVRALDPSPPYPVTVSASLRELADAIDRAMQERSGTGSDDTGCPVDPPRPA